MYFKSSYIQYLFKSTNQHGVHSPFVYQLITKAIYNRKLRSVSKLYKTWQQHVSFSARIQKIINRALYFLNENTFSTVHENRFTTTKTVYFSAEKNSFQDIMNCTDASTFFIIDNLQESKKAQLLWQKLKTDETFTISIDFYDIGFLFIKSGQAKEDFCIRF
ncbi:hypothetical protein [Joostella sp. CR20]|uniref:hypothetical protein n=1 Tax=Joostella sp. CR20 TaxID=2804312 RepID=UPI00313D953B